MLTRRNCLRTLAAAPLLGRAAQSRKPNFIVILADDLGFGDLACYGHPRHETPHLDRMAREGVKFTHFYTPMPFCAPTRATLMTGRYPFRYGMTRNPAPDSGLNDFGLPAGEVTIAEALKPAGYATSCIGKWHLGHTPRFLPRTQGFDEYYGILYSNDMRPVQIVENERVAEYPAIQATLTRRYTERALNFMERNRSKPFFLYLPHAMPHKPLAASEDFYKPGTNTDLYAAAVKELDWSVGQILARLKTLGLDDDTLVLFTSDNGPWFGGNSGGLRGMKGRPWEGGVRVPLIARWPGRAKPGHETKEVAGIIDIFPTITSLAGVSPPPNPLDGRNILPLLTDTSAKTPHEAIFVTSGDKLAFVRSGKWKLHVQSPGADAMVADRPDWVDPRAPDGVTIIAPYEQARPSQYPGVSGGAKAKPMMLFDLDADPSEQRDVADANPDVVERLKSHFDRMNAQVPVPPPVAPHRQLLRLKGGELRYDRVP
ncbi:MAG: sulfatase [Bryobacterales bacterium]|nr:sulfatase [Bryobacterales bacterium]